MADFAGLEVPVIEITGDAPGPRLSVISGCTAASTPRWRASGAGWPGWPGTRRTRGDAFVDVHAGDLVEALEPFVMYDGGPAEAVARDLAAAYGIRYVVRQGGGGRPAPRPRRGIAVRGLPDSRGSVE